MNEDTDGDVFTIAIFCRRNRIAQSTYFVEAREGRGPRVMRIGNAVRITKQSEDQWRREREAQAHSMKKAG